MSDNNPTGKPSPNRPNPQAPASAGPRTPAARPTPGPTAAHPHHVVAPTSDPATWGRVESDGTVWLRTPGGERQIGSWQAGEPNEGLAHFGRRFEDLATEVGLLEARLSAGTDARKTKAAATALLELLPTAAVIGDVESLEQRLRAIAEHSDEATAAARHERERLRQESTARKEALAAEAEGLAAESTQWKIAGDRLRDIVTEWKTIRGVDRKVDDVLWRRYSKAREAFNRRRGAHFAELDRERAAAKAQKEKLCQRAEELSSSTDWAETAAIFRELLLEWKEIGRAPRDTDEALWRRFKSAQDVFFAARNAATSQRDAEFTDNAAAKDELLRTYAAQIDPDNDLAAARNNLRELQTRWEKIGRVPRDRMHDLEERLRAIEKKVRDAADARWRRTDPEVVARAAQFRDRVAQFEQQAAKAEAAGKTKDAQRAREQAAQWREWAEAAEGAVSKH